MAETRQRYRAAIIGLGYIGGGDQVSGDALGQLVSDLDGTHAEAYTRSPRIELIAGSSRDAGRRERFQGRTSARVYADWREMVEREQPEVVSVATYTPQHAEITLACAAQGVRAIFCEKPIAARVAEAEAMLLACREAGALLIINHNRRFHPNNYRLAAAVSEGMLGELTSASVRWGSGRLGNVGTHFLDALALVSGRRIEAVSGTLDLSRRPDCRGADFQDPGGWGVVRLAGGVPALVEATDYGAGAPHLILYGTLGRALVQGPSVTVEFWDGRREEWPAPADGKSSMDRSVEQIVAWLDGTGPAGDTAEAATSTLEAITAFHVSHARNSAWVALPLSPEDRQREIRSG